MPRTWALYFTRNRPPYSSRDPYIRTLRTYGPNQLRLQQDGLSVIGTVIHQIVAETEIGVWRHGPARFLLIDRYLSFTENIIVNGNSEVRQYTSVVLIPLTTSTRGGSNRPRFFNPGNGRINYICTTEAMNENIETVNQSRLVGYLRNYRSLALQEFSPGVSNVTPTLPNPTRRFF